jgi:hypothetical protein
VSLYRTSLKVYQDVGAQIFLSDTVCPSGRRTLQARLSVWFQHVAGASAHLHELGDVSADNMHMDAWIGYGGPVSLCTTFNTLRFPLWGLVID